MSDPNIFVSNGTCYTAAGKKLDKQFIPCGNDAFGHQTCCGAGDNCLADNACFGVHGSGYGSMLTYMAGCTDPEYKDSSCPNKEGIGQPWIALTLCDNSDGVWGACSQSGNPSTLQPGSYCSCTNAASFTPVAFSDSNTLASFASLPQSTGASIQFAAGHTPTGTLTEAGSGQTTGGGGQGSKSESVGSSGGTPTETGTGASTTGGGNSAMGSAGSTGKGASTGTRSSTGIGTTSSTAQVSSTGGATDSSQTGNTSSAKSTSGKTIGIGVGVGIGVLLIIITIITLLLLRRHRRRSAALTNANAEKGDTNDPISHNALPKAGRNSGVDSTAVSEADGRPMSKADYPGTSELDATGVASSRPGTAELMSEPILEADGRTARPWNMGSELDGRPMATGTSGHGSAQVGNHMPTVAELPGSLVAGRGSRRGI